jgi:hypothetical protein
VPESLVSMDWEFWWGFTESMFCFLWFVFNCWFYFYRSKKQLEKRNINGEGM